MTLRSWNLGSLLLVCALTLAACGNDEDPITPTPSTNAATINTSDAPGLLSSYALETGLGAYSASENGTFIVLSTTKDGAAPTDLGVTLVVTGNAAGTFQLGASTFVRLAYTDGSSPYLFLTRWEDGNDNVAFQGTGFVKITEYGSVYGRIKGEFSARAATFNPLTSSTVEEMTVSGSFDVFRGPDGN